MGEEVALIEVLAQVASRPVGLVNLQTIGVLVSQDILTKGISIYNTGRHLYAEPMKKGAFQ